VNTKEIIIIIIIMTIIAILSKYMEIFEVRCKRSVRYEAGVKIRGYS
jgi:hypothetical protein